MERAVNGCYRVPLVGGGTVRVTEMQHDVYQALLACERRGMADATWREVMEGVAAQLGRAVREHTYSARFSELVGLGVLEVMPRRDDRFTQAARAAKGRAFRVTAWRIKRAAPALQRELVADAAVV